MKEHLFHSFSSLTTLVDIKVIYQVSACQRPRDEPTDANKCSDEHDNSIKNSPECVEVIPVFEISLWIRRLNLECAFG